MSLKWKIAQFLEIRWWKRYQSSLDDEYLPKKKDHWFKVLNSVDMRLPKGMNILDVGCGPSGIYTILDGNNVEGIDPLLGKYEKEIDFFNPRSYPHVNFHTMPFEEFESTASYDIVYCLNAINHFRDMELSVKRLYDLLKKDGILVLGIDGHRTRFFKWLFRTIHMDLLHPMQHSLSDYKGLLENLGFKIELTNELTSGKIFNYYIIKAKK